MSINSLLNKYNLIFHQLEVVSRYRDPQLPVGKNYSYLYNLIPNLANHDLILKTHFIPNVSDFVY